MTTTTETRSPGVMVREALELLFERKDVEAVRKYWTDDTFEQFIALGIDVRGRTGWRRSSPSSSLRCPTCA